jgi:hypothetical protein
MDVGPTSRLLVDLYSGLSLYLIRSVWKLKRRTGRILRALVCRSYGLNYNYCMTTHVGHELDGWIDVRLLIGHVDAEASDHVAMNPYHYIYI